MNWDRILPWRNSRTGDASDGDGGGGFFPDEPQTATATFTLCEARVYYTDERSEYITFHDRAEDGQVMLFREVEGIDAYLRQEHGGDPEVVYDVEYGRPVEIVPDNVFKIEPTGEREETFEDTWEPSSDG